MTETTLHGLTYTRPKVVLLQESGIGVSEFAARTCYDSFDNSENKAVKNLNEYISRNIQESDLFVEETGYIEELNTNGRNI